MRKIETWLFVTGVRFQFWKQGRQREKMARPNPKAKLGEGGRFAAIAAKAKKYEATNPEAVAAAVGIKKYGQKKMTSMAVAGRKKAKTGNEMHEAGSPWWLRYRQ